MSKHRCLLLICVVLLVVPTVFATKTSLSNELKFGFVTPIEKPNILSDAGIKTKYTLTATIDKKWNVTVGFKTPSNVWLPAGDTLTAGALLDNTELDEFHIEVNEKEFKLMAAANPSSSKLPRLDDPFMFLPFYSPWGNPQNHIWRISTKQLGIDWVYQHVTDKAGAWYPSMFGTYLKGEKRLGKNDVTLALRTHIGADNYYQKITAAAYGHFKIADVNLTPEIAWSNAVDTKKNMAFGIKANTKLPANLVLDTNSVLSQENYSDNSDKLAQAVKVTWDNKVQGRFDRTGKLSDLDNREYVLAAEYRHSTSNLDFITQFANDAWNKYYSNKSFGLGVTYSTNKKGKTDSALNTLTFKATSPIIAKKLWALTSVSFIEDQDYLINTPLYNARKKIDTGLYTHAELVKDLSLDGYLTRWQYNDAKLFGDADIVVGSATTGLDAQYKINKLYSTKGGLGLVSNQFSSGNTVIANTNAHLIYSTSDNAKLDLGYTRSRNLQEKKPAVHLLNLAITLKF